MERETWPKMSNQINHHMKCHGIELDLDHVHVHFMYRLAHTFRHMRI